MKCYICGNPIKKGELRNWIYCKDCRDKFEENDSENLEKLRFLKILVLPYLQAILYYGSKYHKPNELINPLGEVELDRTSKKFNLIEGIGLYVLLQIAMWLFIGYLGKSEGQLGIAFFDYLGYAIMGIGGLWAIFISPFFHQDTWHGLGFSKPLEVIDYYKKASSKDKRNLIIISIILAILCIFMLILNLDYTMGRMGLNHSAIKPILINEGTDIPTTAGILVAIFAGIILYICLMLFVIRWDNFIPVFKKIFWVAIIVWGGIILSGVGYAIADNDWSKFQNFTWLSWDSQHSFIPHIGFYAIWGLIQQWLFLGYFNTRLRKGFGNNKVGRVLTIITTGLFFGCIHIPALPLMLVTFTGGCFFGYYFQKDEYRNIFIMGIAHGVGGTLVGQVTPMIMVVGPWAV